MKNKNINIDTFNPALVLGLSIITLGLFIPFWFYLKNLEFEKISDEAPVSTRAIIVLFIIPFIWILLSGLLHFSIKFIGFTLILLLIEKYIFDFCFFFSHLTKSNFFIYFILFSISLIGIYLSLFEKFFLFLSLILFFTIPIMQQELNVFYKRNSIKKERNFFYNS